MDFLGEHQGRAVVGIKPLLRLVWDVGGEVDLEKGRFVNRLDPEAAGDLLVQLGKNIEVAAEQGPVGFDPHEILIFGDEHGQKHDLV